MQLIVFLGLFAVIFIEAASARRRYRPNIPPPPPPTIIIVQNEPPPLGPYNYNYCAPKCTQKSYDELILPPIRAELPRGLGYFPSAVPLVASCFNQAVDVGSTCCGASVPVISSNNCATIAAPMCPEWAPLVRPIIL